MRVLVQGSPVDLPADATGLDAVRAFDEPLADEAVLIRANGEPRDLRLPVAEGEQIEVLTSADRGDPDALAVLRHSAAHLLAEAARRVYPGTKVAIGPPTADGFYYDFEFPEPVGEEAVERIQAEMEREIAEGRSWRRRVVDRDEARTYFEEQDEPYKVELVDSADGEISFYEQGDFVDLCRGPHLQDARPLKAVKLLSLAGAYWRGDERNPQLTRIYGTAFYEPEDLKHHVEHLEEAARRDHRRLGKELELFTFSPLAPGMPLWLPNGATVWNALDDLRRRENARRGYTEVKTPLLYDVQLWHTSGHYDKFREDMFFLAPSGREAALKPMNCPGHCLVYAASSHSYRELPLRLAEAGTLHRNEASGVLHGIMRARYFHQDDAHIFCTPEQIEEEVLACLDFGFYLYRLFELEMRVELSTRPEQRLGSDEDWDAAEAALAQALRRANLEYETSPGEGAFYGPKIDMHMSDALGRSWQLGTIQLDFQMPARFGLTYDSADNVDRTPVMIHRALLGSYERFLGILLEHTGGDLPFFLVPEQVRVLPVSSPHVDAAQDLARELRERGFRVGADVREETLGKRIRAAQLAKIPYVVVWGDRESRDALAVRRRHGDQSTTSLEALVYELSAQMGADGAGAPAKEPAAAG